MSETLVATEKILETVREVREKIISKYAAVVDAEKRYPYESMRALRDAGLFALPVPREHGGLASCPEPASDAVLFNQVFREIARSCSSTAQVFFVHCMAVGSLFRGGTSEQHRFVASAVLRDGAAFAVASAEGGKTIEDRRTTIRPVDGGYLLNGTKLFCTGHGGARYLSVGQIQLLDPQDGDTPLRLRGGRCLVALDQPGVTCNDDWDNVGQRGTTSGSVTFRDVFVPQSMFWMWDESPLRGPVLQCAFSSIFLGAAEGALEAATEYVRTTTRPHPLAGVERAVDDPTIQWRFGDMAYRVHAAGLVVEDASRALEQAYRQQITRDEVSRRVAMAKIASTEAALEVTSRIFQVMGARSTANRYNFDRYWRDVRTLTLHDPVDQKYRLLGRSLLTGEEVPIMTTF